MLILWKLIYLSPVLALAFMAMYDAMREEF